MGLPNYVVNDPDLLTIGREQLDTLQSERLGNMVRYVFERSSFWRGKLELAGVDPESVRSREDVRRLPTCNKKELQEEQEKYGPFGRYACTPRWAWTRYFMTSGTTGRPLHRVFSARDWGYVLDRFARLNLWEAGDVVLFTAPVDGVTGPTAGMEGAAHAGALAIPAGLWSTERKVESIVSIRPSSISGSLSYLRHLAEVAHRNGKDLSSCGVRTVNCVGEPGAAIEGTRTELSNRFGGAAVMDGYGMTELFPLGGNCPFSSSIHLPEDLVLVECLRPGSNETVPTGELGELVYTNLVGDTQPLLRYRSGDLGRLTGRSPCKCGHTHARIEGSIKGRVDDMIWYRGVNFFPTAVEEVVSSAGDVGSEYQILLSDDGRLPHLTVRVEQTDPMVETKTIARSLGTALKSAIGVTAQVEVLPTNTLPRPGEGAKVRRVVDQRNSWSPVEEAE